MMDCSETIEVYGTKVGIYSKLNEYMEIYKVILWPLSKVTQISLFSNSFCHEATRQTAVKLHSGSSWVMGTQSYQSSWGHMTQMAAMHINGKNL